MVLYIVLAVVVLIVFVAIALYNSIIRKRNDVRNTFSSIDVMLKKRFDLIPNLVATVKQYTEHESSIFEKVAESHKVAYNSLSDADKVAIDSNMQMAQRSFFAIAEQFPELKASENFKMLQASLNETEEQLSAARRTYNAAVTDFNTAIQSFPANLFAGSMGFTEFSLLEIPQAEKANVSVADLFNK